MDREELELVMEKLCSSHFSVIAPAAVELSEPVDEEHTHW